jgi:CRISPR-associated protein Cmr2
VLDTRKDTCMPNNLMIIALGPVQEFIASARRSRDLWYGSWLLSELSKTAARTICDSCGIEALIFPTPLHRQALEPDSALNVANKIVAIVPGPPEAVAELAADVDAAVNTHLAALAAAVFTAIGSANLDDRTTADHQIADLAEVYWVAHPLAADLHDYAATRRYLEALLAARKTTRDFRQLDGRANRPKSSLDGVRESVIPAANYPDRSDTPEIWAEKARALYATYGAGPAEQLSGADVLKRVGSRDRHFPSTSHFAAAPYVQRIGSARLNARLPSLLTALREFQIQPDRVATGLPGTQLLAAGVAYDASLLFSSRLTEDVKEESRKRDIIKLLDRFLQDLGGSVRPQPYYALLQADGDHMGATIDALLTPNAHAQISAALNQFAARVPAIVQTYAGAAVYSGGDDVLAFLPLHTVLDCATALADAFAEELATLAGSTAPAPTLSTGIAITHHIEPLADALRLVRTAERTAKQVDGKHALAIILSKRSGGDRLVVGPRRDLNSRLQRLITLHRSDAIPEGAAYQVEDMLVRLHRPGSVVTAPALRFEAKRIMQHKPVFRAPSGAPTATRDLLHDLLDDTSLPLDELVNELIVAKFFAGAVALAEGE